MITSAATLQYVQQHLDEDMELLARMQPSPITPALSPRSTSPSTPVSGDAYLLLQIVYAQDVSLSLRERLQALVPPDTPITSLSWSSDTGASTRGGGDENGDDDGDFAMNEEEDPNATAAASASGVALATLRDSEAVEEARHRKQYTGSGPWRCLRLVLTDGFTRIIGVEDRRAAADGNVAGRGPPPLPSGVTLGSKIKIKLDAQGLPLFASHGILRLHRDNVVFMGGEVRALQVLAETEARRQLEAMTGRPSRAQRRASVNDVDLLTPAPAMGANPVVPAVPSRVEAPRAARPSPQPSQTHQQPQSSQRAAYNTLPVNALEAWEAHARSLAGQPFRTQAVVTEVVSDMLLNEYPPSMATQLLPATLAAAQSSSSSDTIILYSLLIQLSSPAAAAAASQSGTQVSSDASLIADLGHAWLLELVGMPPLMFRALSEAATRDAQQAARLQAIIERVGRVLETLGVVTVVLQQRPLDQVVEVMHVDTAAA